MKPHPRHRIGAVALAAVLGPLLIVACSDSSDSAATGSKTERRDTTTTTKPDCTDRPAPDGAAGSGTKPIVEHMEYGGATREYQVALPKEYDGATEVPLLLQFHGFNSDRTTMDHQTGLGEAGAKKGFAVVTPTSLGSPRQWNMFAADDQADDFGFVAELVKQLEDDLCVDTDRIFAAGHSNGSAFSGFLPCRVPKTFAGIAMVSATIPPTCAGEKPWVYAAAGSADLGVPAGGGSVAGGSVGIPPADESMAAYRKAYGCDAEAKRSEPLPGVVEDSGVGCVGDKKVEYVLVEGGTHPWPGSPDAKADPQASEAGKTYSATDAILELFSQV